MMGRIITVAASDCLVAPQGKYLTIEGVRFAYGHEQMLAALESNDEYAAHRREHGEKAVRASEPRRQSGSEPCRMNRLLQNQLRVALPYCEAITERHEGTG